MAKSGLKHIDVGPELTKTEWESEDSHELVHGTSFPASPVERQLFYRDDEHKWYIYNASAWVWLGGGSGGGMSVHGNEYHDPDFATEAALSSHAAAATGTHGVGASTVESIAGSQGKVDTHAAVAAPHSGHINHSLATAVSDFLVASGAGAFVKKTLAEVKTLLNWAADIATHAALTTGVHGVGAGTIAKVGDIAVDANLSAAGQDAISKRHTQGTDTALGAVGTKNPPIDADKALYRDSAASDALKTSTWTQIKAFLKTYWDTLYEAIGSVATHAGLTTGVHGVGASTVESASGSQSKVDTHAALTNPHSATDAATPSRIVLRDANARAKFAAPAAAGDALIKDTQLTLTEIPRAASGLLKAKGAGVNPAYERATKAEMEWTTGKLLKGAGVGADPTEVVTNISCKATKSGDQTIPNATWATITFDQEAFDTDTIHDTVTNNDRLTIKTPGTYLIFAVIRYAANATGNRSAHIAKNAGGDTVAEAGMLACTVSGLTTVMTIGTVELCSANDYYTISTYQSSGGNLDITSAATQFCAVKLTL